MNYYEILKLSKNATEHEIKSSYKKLVKQYHPDLYVGDKDFAEQKIKEINEAYDILSNPETKAKYDEYLDLSEQPPTQTYASPTPPANNTNYNSTENQPPKWSLSKFILEKFSKLDKKRQLQIFIALFIFILSLFLINLIEVKHYLTNQQATPVPTNSTQNTTSNITEFTEINPDTFYEGNEIETLDDLFYQLFMQYQGNTNYENQF